MALTARFHEALTFAHVLHAGKRQRGTGAPRISHLLAVCALVIEAEGCEDEAIAALLHDALEDRGRHCPGGMERLRLDIEARFGTAVLNIVEGCHPGDAAGSCDSGHQHRQLLQRLSSAPAPVRLVTCAETLQELRSLLTAYRESGPVLWERLEADRDTVLSRYQALAEEFARDAGLAGCRHRRLARELAWAVTHLTQLVKQAEPAAERALPCP